MARDERQHGQTRRLASSLLAAALAVGACGEPAPSPTPQLIPAEAATATAIASVVSRTPVTVMSVYLSSYPATRPAWAVVLSGSFGVPSCASPTTQPGCPPPVSSALVMIDAVTGVFLESAEPAPSFLPLPASPQP